MEVVRIKEQNPIEIKKRNNKDFFKHKKDKHCVFFPKYF